MVDHLLHHVRLNALALRANGEEILNSITHGAGLAMAAAGSVALVGYAGAHADGWRMAGCVVFAVTLTAVYAASTLSHLAQRRPWRHFFRTWDQALIYLLITGTYTPFALTYLRGGAWWLLTAAMWTIALYGFAAKVLFKQRIDAISVSLYLALGWLPAIGIPQYLDIMPAACMLWILGGGVLYTVGAAFLMLDHKWFFFHAIWHVMVIAGSACHYFAVWRYVAGEGPGLG
jgi:hemolysin III